LTEINDEESTNSMGCLTSHAIGEAINAVQVNKERWREAGVVELVKLRIGFCQIQQGQGKHARP
jgi:hypothetical protein